MQHKQYWNKLKKFLIQKQSYIPEIKEIAIFPKKEYEDYDVFYVGDYEIKQIKQKDIDKSLLIKSNEHLIDNTGFFYWPAEQILTKYLMENTHLLQKQVYELGAGKSGFCGLFLAMKGYQVTITDGNDNTMNQLEQNIKINNVNVNSYCQVWNDGKSFKNTTAIIADCFFFEDYHQDLLKMIKRFHNCVAAAPSRGGSLERFLKIYNQHYNVIEYLDIYIIIFDNS